MEYDYDELVKYYNTRNYTGAIDYINKFNYEGNDAVIMRKEIDKLRRAADIEESNRKRLVGEDAEAFNFIKGLQSNYIDRTRKGKYADEVEFSTVNRYGDEYLGYMQNLQTKDGNSIDTIGIEIEDTEALDRLKQSLLENGTKLEDLGAKVSSIADGKFMLQMGTDNTNVYQLVNASKHLNAVDNRKALAIAGGIGAGIGTLVGLFTGGITVGAATPFGATVATGLTGSVLKYFDDYKIKGISNGKVYDNSDFDVNSLYSAVDLVNKAKDKYDDINSRIIEAQSQGSEISVSSYKSLGHERMAQMLASGQLKAEQYNKLNELWDESLDNIIAGSAFSTKNVYAFGNEDGDTEDGKLKKGILLRPVKGTDSEDLKTEILRARKEDRCNVQMATKDGRLGTLFTITPDENKNKLLDTFGNRELQVFIEDLYTGTLEEEYYNDSKTIAAQTNADMKRYGYSTELANGERIGYEQGTPYKTVYNPQTTKFDAILISEEEILNNINESNNINNSIDYILQNYDKNNGSVSINDGSSIKNYNKNDAVDMFADNIASEEIDKESNPREHAIKKARIVSLINSKLLKYIQ